MKKLLIFLAVMAGCFGLTIGGVSAHVLKVDGEISAELHIEPDDNPISGKPSVYELFFDDTSGRFSLAKCNCSVTFQGGGDTPPVQPLHAVGALSSENTLTPPTPGNYSLRIEGQPKQPGAFQPFALEFPQRVAAPGGADVQPFPRILALGLGAGMIVILLAAYKQNHDFTGRKDKK